MHTGYLDFLPESSLAPENGRFLGPKRKGLSLNHHFPGKLLDLINKGVGKKLEKNPVSWQVTSDKLIY